MTTHTPGPVMSPETLAALKDSIAHWTRLAEGKRLEGEQPGWRHCALCSLFIGPFCVGCPVREATGTDSCEDTPYPAAAKAWRLHGLDSPKFQAAAAVMRDFLVTLLPEGER